MHGEGRGGNLKGKRGGERPSREEEEGSLPSKERELGRCERG